MIGVKAGFFFELGLELGLGLELELPVIAV